MIYLIERNCYANYGSLFAIQVVASHKTPSTNHCRNISLVVFPSPYCSCPRLHYYAIIQLSAPYGCHFWYAIRLGANDIDAMNSVRINIQAGTTDIWQNWHQITSANGAAIIWNVFAQQMNGCLSDCRLICTPRRLMNSTETWTLFYSLVVLVSRFFVYCIRRILILCRRKGILFVI